MPAQNGVVTRLPAKGLRPLALVPTLFTVLTLGIGTLLVVPEAALLRILLLIMMILAAVAASNGKEHKYPFMLFRLVKN